MVQQIIQNMKNEDGVKPVSNSNIEGKLKELTRSVSEVYKYELLTTNQYLKQMELVLEIFNEISETLEH